MRYLCDALGHKIWFRVRQKAKFVGISLAAVLATAIASPCLAIDYQPFDWVSMAPGTNAAR